MQPHTPPGPPAAPDPNPFRFGWRYVRRVQPDGSEVLEQVPLTLEDVLHPQEGDEIPVRSLHEMDCAYLAGVFRSRPLGPPIVRITADLSIDWGVPELRDTSPDVAIFVGLREEPNLEEGTFHLAESGGRCLLALEVVSPDRRVNDVVHKFREYHIAGVPLYIIIDQIREGGPRWLVAYRHTPEGYAPVELDSQGRLLLEPLGLTLQVRDDRVVCEDAATGRELGDYARLARELEEADRRNAEQEKALEEAVEALHEKTRAEREAREQARRDQIAREEAERRAQQQAKAREEAERRARQDALAREQAERLAKQQAEAREAAERLAQEAATAREEAEREAGEQARRAKQAEERIRELEALLRQQQGDGPR